VFLPPRSEQLENIITLLVLLLLIVTSKGRGLDCGDKGSASLVVHFKLTPLHTQLGTLDNEWSLARHLICLTLICNRVEWSKHDRDQFLNLNKVRKLQFHLIH
jgi:hypothetical protein